MNDLVTTEDSPIPEMRLPAPQTITVTQRRIACDGDDHAGSGHPRVWLAISPDLGFVDCGYCDKRFVLDTARAADDH